VMQSEPIRVQCEIPEFLMSEFCFDDFDLVDIINLYVGLVSVSGDCVVYVPVYNTPHYVFVRNVIYNEDICPAAGYQNYKHYLKTNPSACSERQFMRLIKDITDNGYDWKNRPILVFRNWRRYFPRGRRDVADGFHRLAVLAALGENKIKVGVLRYQHNVLSRMKKRLCGDKIL
jgi:hypothetical protein